jgi:hypothetical protein
MFDEEEGVGGGWRPRFPKKLSSNPIGLSDEWIRGEV